MEKRKFRFFALILVMAVVLCGCGDNKTQTAGGNAAGTTGNSTAAGNEQTTSSTVKDSAVVGIQQDIDSLDPDKAVAAGTKEILFNIYEGLVKPDENGKLVPAVASDYKISEDGMTYTFTLRDGITFQDGSLVTTGDIVYSVKRSAGLLETSDPEVVTEPALSSISDVKAVDDKTVEITLKAANTELLGYLTCAVVPEDSGDSLAKTPMGTGPFAFASYTPLEKLVLKKYDGYWGTKAHLTEVTFKIVSDTDSAMLALQSGSIDIYPYVTSDQAEQLSGNFTILDGTMGLVQGLFLNNENKLFQDVRVRQAVNYAVDRQALIDMVGGGKGTALETDMFPELTEYYNADTANTYSYDPAKAKELLAEAGYPDGITFTITVPSNYDFHVSTAQVLVEQLAQAGITAKIQEVEETAWLSDVYTKRNYEATITGLAAKVLMPGRGLSRYASTATNNFMNYKSDAYDALLAKALATTDENEKVADYKQLQQMLTDDAASVYLQDPALLVAINPDLTGYKFYPIFVQDMASIAWK